MRVLIAGAAALMFAATPCAAESPAADPRTPEAIALQTALDRICLPLVGGRDVEEVAKATGLRDKDGQWVLPLTGDKRISVLPPSRANPNVCSLTVTYDVGHNGPLLSLMNAWAGAKGLAARKVREPSEGPMRDRWTSSWEGPSMAVVFSEEKTRDGQPVGGDVDQATVLLSVSKTA